MDGVNGTLNIVQQIYSDFGLNFDNVSCEIQQCEMAWVYVCNRFLGNRQIIAWLLISEYPLGFKEYIYSPDIYKDQIDRCEENRILILEAAPFFDLPNALPRQYGELVRGSTRYLEHKHELLVRAGLVNEATQVVYFYARLYDALFGRMANNWDRLGYQGGIEARINYPIPGLIGRITKFLNP